VLGRELALCASNYNTHKAGDKRVRSHASHPFLLLLFPPFPFQKKRDFEMVREKGREKKRIGYYEIHPVKSLSGQPDLKGFKKNNRKKKGKKLIFFPFLSLFFFFFKPGKPIWKLRSAS